MNGLAYPLQYFGNFYDPASHLQLPFSTFFYFHRQQINIYFSVYCCYELTSIVDRSLFQVYADMMIAVEWNKDINYYSNILESLSRDMHCYCIQVNTSDYGDSRITRPSKTEGSLYGSRSTQALPHFIQRFKNDRCPNLFGHSLQPCRPADREKASTPWTAGLHALQRQKKRIL